MNRYRQAIAAARSNPALAPFYRRASVVDACMLDNLMAVRGQAIDGIKTHQTKHGATHAATLEKCSRATDRLFADFVKWIRRSRTFHSLAPSEKAGVECAALKVAVEMEETP